MHLGMAADKAVRVNLYPQASNTKITHPEEKFIIFFQFQTNETNKQKKLAWKIFCYFLEKNTSALSNPKPKKVLILSRKTSLTFWDDC